MAIYNNINLTAAGRALLDSRIFRDAAPLTVTAIALGDGQLSPGETEASRTSLVHLVKMLALDDVEQADGTLTLHARLASDTLDADFMQREIGIYAGETLLAYANAGDNYDAIPATGKATAIVKNITARLSIGSAQVVFETLPTDDLVTFAAMEARIRETVPAVTRDAVEKLVEDGILRDGLDAFETWKKEEDSPDATWDDYMAAIKGAPGESPAADDVARQIVPLLADEVELVGPEAPTNTNTNYFTLGSAYLEPGVVLKEFGYHVKSNAANGMCEQPCYIGVWEQSEDGSSWVKLGTSNDTQTQVINTDILWTFELGEVKLSGRPLRFCLLSARDEGWRTNLLMGVRCVATTAADTYVYPSGNETAFVVKYELRGYKTLNEKGDKGDPGDPGRDGAPGADGAPGESAYQVAVRNGFSGSESDWLESLKGERGEQGIPGEVDVDLVKSIVDDEIVGGDVVVNTPPATSQAGFNWFQFSSLNLHGKLTRINLAMRTGNLASMTTAPRYLGVFQERDGEWSKVAVSSTTVSQVVGTDSVWDFNPESSELSSAPTRFCLLASTDAAWNPSDVFGARVYNSTDAGDFCFYNNSQSSFVPQVGFNIVRDGLPYAPISHVGDPSHLQDGEREKWNGAITAANNAAQAASAAQSTANSAANNAQAAINNTTTLATSLAQEKNDALQHLYWHHSGNYAALANLMGPNGSAYFPEALHVTQEEKDKWNEGGGTIDDTGNIMGGNASGENATAVGKNSIAKGKNSTALGNGAKANGIGSTAIGYGATAEEGEFAMMARNNRTDSSSYLDIRWIAQASPKAVENLGGQAGIYWDTGGIKNFMKLNDWFRLVEKTDEILESVSGNYVLSGNVSGNLAIAIGDGSNAVGDESLAIGRAFAIGEKSFAAQTGANASGFCSTAIGNDANSSSDYATAIGTNAAASGDNSTSIGFAARADGENAVAIGYNAQTEGTNSTAIGNAARTTADGTFAIGSGALAENGEGVLRVSDDTEENSVEFVLVCPNTPLSEDYLDGEAGLAFGVNGEHSGERKYIKLSRLFNLGSSPGDSVSGNSDHAGSAERSVQLGQQANAKGINSVAVGYNTNTLDGSSVAIGSNVTARTGSVCIGSNYQGEVVDYTVSVGFMNSVDSKFGIGIGYNVSSKGASVAIGRQASAMPKYADGSGIAIGNGAKSDDDCVCFRVSYDSNISTEFYLFGASSKLAKFTGGYPGLGYVSRSNKGTITARGCVNLFSLCTDHKTDFEYVES